MPMIGFTPACFAAFVKSTTPYRTPWCDGDGSLVVGGDDGDQLVDPGRPVEHRELGMDVEMYEPVGAHNNVCVAGNYTNVSTP